MSTSCETVPCQFMFFIISASFNQGVPLASSTSCESVPRQYIYIWANSSKFQSVPLATSTSCESVPCTPVYSRLNTFFNQDVPLAKSTSCGTVPCTPLWFLQISIKMSHWRRVRLTGRCHAGTSSFFFWRRSTTYSFLWHFAWATMQLPPKHARL